MAEYPHILAANAIENASHTLENGAGTGLAEDPVYRLAHLGDRSRLSKWRGHSSNQVQRVKWLFGEPVQCDTFVLDKNFNFNPGATLKLQHSADGSTWTTALTLEDLQSDSIYWRSFTDTARPLWSILIEGLTCAPGIFNLWLGKRIELNFGPSGNFDPYEEETVGENVHGASGGFQRVHRYRRRVFRAFFENLIDSQYCLLGQWWQEAGCEGKNWWWLTWPESEPGDPLYLNCEGTARRFGFYRGSARSGEIAAWEVK
ncbi:MAG: hypothetical protein U9P14_11885 [Gemmatimonadota bacterium]|nr:hypothetical protein [Gemmatimonadota bacterium]